MPHGTLMTQVELRLSPRHRLSVLSTDASDGGWWRQRVASQKLDISWAATLRFLVFHSKSPTLPSIHTCVFVCMFLCVQLKCPVSMMAWHTTVQRAFVCNHGNCSLPKHGRCVFYISACLEGTFKAFFQAIWEGLVPKCVWVGVYSHILTLVFVLFKNIVVANNLFVLEISRNCFLLQGFLLPAYFKGAAFVIKHNRGWIDFFSSQFFSLMHSVHVNPPMRVR